MTVCSRCGKENQDHYKFCLGCGSDLTAINALSTAPSARARHSLDDGAGPLRHDARGAMAADAASGLAATVASSGPRALGGPGQVVGSPGPAGGGNSLPVAGPPMRACPSCGKPVPYEFVFCGSCGTRLGAAAAPATVTPRPHFGNQVGMAPVPQTRGRLVLIRPDGGEGGSMALAEGESLIGRNEGALFDSDSYLSPKHAYFVFRGANLIVRDAGSLNGVFVKMSGEEEIADGEVFRLGQELLRFDVIRPAQPLEDGTEVMGSPNPGYWGRLSVILGRGQDGSAFPLFGEAMIVGRERGDILFPEDGYVSGTHARISRRDGRFYLSDLNSSNGSFLRIRGERALRSGAFLLLGQQLFRIQYS